MIKFLLITIASWFFACSAFAQSFSLIPRYSSQHAENYDGTTQGALLNVRFNEQLKVGLLYEKKTREYTTSELEDNLYGVSAVYSNDNFYIENDGYWTENYYWLPKYVISTTPHLILGDGWDVGLGFTYRSYPYEVYKTFSPSLGKYIGSFFLRAQENITMGEDQTIYSSQGLVRYYFEDDLFFEVNGAAGKTTEDRGVIESFHDVGVGTKFSVSTLLNLIIQANAHRSDTIKEDSYGFTVEFKL